MSHHNQHCIDVCNRLLRGERSAVETYNLAIEKHPEHPLLQGLHRIRDEHVEAVNLLQQNVLSMGGTPEEDAGAWGVFARTVQSAANLIGENSAIAALQNGEKSGQSDYKSAVDDKEVMPECKNLILTKLLPRVEEHIAALEILLKKT